MSQMLIPENPRKWWVLIATGLCLALSFLDQTAVVVILPVIQKDLAATTLQMEWVVNTYMLVMAAFFVLGGRLGDLYGEKRIFIIGMFLFLVASVICGHTATINMLFLGRGLQGLGSALLVPAQSVILINAFPLKERGRALGINLSIGSIFIVAGGFLGGFIEQLFSWSMVFWINIPIGLISAGVALWAVIPDRLKQHGHAIDWNGLFWQWLAIITLVFGIMELDHLRWYFCLVLFFIALISFYQLYRVEKKQEHPLINFDIFKIRTFNTGCIVISLIQMVLIAGVFSTLFYQDVLGVSPLIAGLMSLPGLLPVLFMGPVAGWLLDRFGARLPLLLGLTLVLFSGIWGTALLHLLSYKWLLPGLILMGFGVPMVMNSTFTTALSAIELHNRGLASGTLGMLRQVGNSIGLAISSAIVNIINDQHINVQLVTAHLAIPVATVESVFSKVTILHTFSTLQQKTLITMAKHALSVAINSAMLWTTLVTLVMWIIVFIRTKHNPEFLQKDKQ